VLFAEMAKCLISLSMLGLMLHRGEAKAVGDLNLKTGLMFSVPGLLYFVNNNIPFYCLMYLEPPSYQVRLPAVRACAQNHRRPASGLNESACGGLFFMHTRCYSSSRSVPRPSRFACSWPGCVLVLLLASPPSSYSPAPGV
jgi:hypothetical protein